MKQVTVVTVREPVNTDVCTFVLDGHLTNFEKDKVRKAVCIKNPEWQVLFVFSTDLGAVDPWLVSQVLDTTIALRKG